jgi:N-methylhydantoinase A
MVRVCIDIGGTFTDCVVLDDTGNLTEFKAPSTPADFAEGVMSALHEAAAAYSQTVEQFVGAIELIVHGTTVATNALVTRNVARTAMITTKGFRDIIEMRRALKIETRSMYEAFIPPYEPIIPRYLRFTVDEETLYTGEIVRPLNENELADIIERIKKEEVKAVALCFINSYANPENEIRAAQICQQELQDVFVTYSSDILPKMGEYERESTCVMSASVGPVVSRYMTSLEERLKEADFRGQLLIMQANQFAQSVSAIKRKPVYLMGSGPAAAPAGGVYLGDILGEPNLITVDMGGTTLDTSLIKDGKVPLATGKWLGDEMLGIKVVDVNSVGAGGGSIAWIDSLGLLRVGPHSAGAEPGPACYGKGGREPTLTDAATILGYVPSDYFWGGKLRLNVDLAKSAMKDIAERMHMTIEDVAQAIFTTINSTMADGITEISTRIGYDVRDFSLLAMGGGGPLCGAFLAEILGIRKVIVPKFAASFCAWSMFSLDIGRDYVRSYICTASDADPDVVNQLYEEMVAQAVAEFAALKVSKSDLIIDKYAEVRYRGQYHEVEMSFKAGDVTSGDIDQLVKEFHKRHEELYTFAMPWVPIEFRNVRLIARVGVKKIQLQKIAAGTKNPSEAQKRTRLCCFDGSYVETPIYDSSRLKSGNVIPGPAVVEEPLTTVVIPKGFHCDIDEYGNYIMRKK